MAISLQFCSIDISPNPVGAGFAPLSPVITFA
jgi:hypothetical protein